MADYVTLLGAEQVASAGHAMREAAAEMNRAAANFDGAVAAMRQLVERFEQACSKFDGGGEHG